MTELREQFGEIDIYLFDQLLKSRITPAMTVLDAGCGSGRNLVYLARMGCEVYAVDRSEEAVRRTRQVVESVQADVDGGRFRVEPLDALTFEDAAFDVVICSAVLHFADDSAHFDRMVAELWRVLRAGGMLFARLASSIGIVDRIVPIGSGRYRLPDGTDRYLVDETTLVALTERLDGTLVEPIKTTNVQGQRCMTTWCVRRRSRA